MHPLVGPHRGAADALRAAFAARSASVRRGRAAPLVLLDVGLGAGSNAAAAWTLSEARARPSSATAPHRQLRPDLRGLRARADRRSTPRRSASPGRPARPARRSSRARPARRRGHRVARVAGRAAGDAARRAARVRRRRLLGSVLAAREPRALDRRRLHGAPPPMPRRRDRSHLQRRDGDAHARCSSPGSPSDSASVLPSGEQATVAATRLDEPRRSRSTVAGSIVSRVRPRRFRPMRRRTPSSASRDCRNFNDEIALILEDTIVEIDRAARARLAPRGRRRALRARVLLRRGHARSR